MTLEELIELQKETEAGFYISLRVDVARELIAAAIEYTKRQPGDVWADDPDHPRELWQYEVGNGETTLGYWDWVQHQKEATSGT